MSDKKKDGPKAINPKKVKMVKAYDRFKAGELVNHHGVVADAWIRRKLAVAAGDGDPKTGPAVVMAEDKK